MATGRFRVGVEADGGARGNPGPAGFGAVVLHAATDEVLTERSGAIGIATNNVAEYRGLIAGLEAAAEIGAVAVDVRMDSKLVVEQMSGRWQIKHPGLRPLAAQAADLARRFDEVTYSWIPRHLNKRADALANRAMDEAAGKPAAARPTAALPTAVRPSAADPSGAGSSGVDLSGVDPVGADPSGVDPVGAGPAGTGGRAAARAAGATPAAGWEPRTGAPLRLLLVRHGESTMTVQRRYSGRGDAALTVRGLAQANAVAARITALGTPLTAVVTSPLQRCVRTAEFITGAPVTPDADLVECDFGVWEGLTFGEVRAGWPDEMSAWLASTAVAPPGGESFGQVQERVRRAVARLTQRYESGVVAVVSHVSPLKLILRDALAAGDAFLHRCYLDPAGLSIVDLWPDGGVAVRTVNDTAHLR